MRFCFLLFFPFMLIVCVFVLLFFVSFCLLLLLLLFLSCYSLLCYSYSFVIEFWSKIHYLSSFFFRVLFSIFIFFVFFVFFFPFCLFFFFFGFFFLRFVTVSLQLVFCLSVAFPLAFFVYLFVLFVPIFSNNFASCLIY